MKNVGLLSAACGDENRQPNLFSILDEDAKERFQALCKPVKFTTGQSLFVQGYEHDGSYIIEDGLIRTYYVSPSGREVTLGYWSTGDLVGGPAVLGGGIHVWSGVAARDTNVLAISGPALRTFAASDPEVTQWIIDVLGFKLRWLSILFQIHGTDCVQDRLAKLLVLMAENYGLGSERGTVIDCKITQGDLGTLIGASRQWTNKTLTEFKEKGLLEIKGRKIVLRDMAALRRQTQAVNF